jgi:hypothetical protein
MLSQTRLKWEFCRRTHEAPVVSDHSNLPWRCPHDTLTDPNQTPRWALRAGDDACNSNIRV